MTAGLGVALLAAALLLTRTPRPPAPPVPRATAIDQVRAQLALAPVLAAEAAVRQRSADVPLHLGLARACAGSGDPTGAALAIYPTLAGAPSPDLTTLYARYCTQAGWLDEAGAALRRLPTPPIRERLDLAESYANHGQVQQAAALLNGLASEKLPADAWSEGAITWYHCRRPREAVQWARRGVSGDPKNPAGRAVLARCLLAEKRPEAALKILTEAPSTAADPVAGFWRGCAEVHCRDAALRRAGLERLSRLAADGTNAMATFEAGRAFLLAGQAGHAVPLLSRAAVSGYQDVVCYDLLSRAYVSLGRPADAAWARARGEISWCRFPTAVASLRRSLELEPGKPMAYVDLAKALHADGKPREALAVLERAQQVVPGNLDVSLLKARLLLHMERPADVARELEAAAGLDPARANEPLGNLGTVYYDSQQFEQAVPVLERAVQAEDADAHSHFYLGRTYARYVEEPGRAEKAVYHLLRAAQMQPDYSRPWVAAAAVLQRMDHVPEAAACLRRAIAGDALSDAAYLALGRLLQLQGRLPERRLILKLYAATRDHDLKRTGLEKETRDHPQDAEKRYALGDLLLREGRPQMALPELLAAAGPRPGWKKAWARLADACALLGYDDLREEAERAER